MAGPSHVGCGRLLGVAADLATSSRASWPTCPVDGDPLADLTRGRAPAGPARRGDRLGGARRPGWPRQIGPRCPRPERRPRRHDRHRQPARPAHLDALDDLEGSRRDDLARPQVPAERGRPLRRRVLDDATTRRIRRGTSAVFPPGWTSSGRGPASALGPRTVVERRQPRSVACGQDQVPDAGNPIAERGSSWCSHQKSQ